MTEATFDEPTTEPDNSTRYRRLRLFNILVGLAFVAQIAVILKLSKPLSIPLVLGYLNRDPLLNPNVIAKPVEVISIGIASAVAIFLACAALDHLLVAFPLRSWYERQLGRRANYARWIEYTFSSSLMVVLIVVIVGVRDLGAIIAIISTNSAMILFGLLMERKETPGKADWSAFWFSSAVSLAPWIIISLFLAHATPPAFVYVIVIVQFVLFFSFAANMGLQYKQVGKWKDYIYGEYAYIILSIVAKSLLAWLIFANVLRPAGS